MKRRLNQQFLTGLIAVGLLLGSAAWLEAEATKLPPGVIHYLEEKDPGVRIRFDGLVTLSNGENYLPVIPQDPQLMNRNAMQVVKTEPEQAKTPDLIQFDNNYFLIRLIKTPGGRLSLPVRRDYPIQLKEGLLPQDLVLPANLFIPSGLKIILGELPYNPSTDAGDDLPDSLTAIMDAAVMDMDKPALTEPHLQSAANRVFLYNLDKQQLTVIDPQTGTVLGAIGLGCVPANVRIHPALPLAFVTCLSTDELAVIDTTADLVKTRIPVGENPADILILEEQGKVVVSNRFSNHLSFVDLTSLLPEETLPLPGQGGLMARYSQNILIVADAFDDQIYLVDLRTGTVARTLTGIPNTTGLWLYVNRDNRPEVWVTSRSTHQLKSIDLLTGEALATIDVGKKPVGMVADNGKLFVLSAGDARIDVVDMAQRRKTADILLGQYSFPADIFKPINQSRAFIAAANETRMFIVDLNKERVAQTVNIPFRANVIAYTGTVSAKEPPPGQVPDPLPDASGLQVNFEQAGSPDSTLVIPLDLDDLPVQAQPLKEILSGNPLPKTTPPLEEEKKEPAGRLPADNLPADNLPMMGEMILE